MAANGTILNLEIEELAIDDSDNIDLPASVDKKVFQRALYIAQKFSTYEGKPTGALRVLSARGLGSMPLEADSHLLLGGNTRNIADVGMEGPLRKAFSQDGGILIDGETGEILTELSQFYPRPSKFVLSGHGCRHRMALDLAAQECLYTVSIARSTDGFVTVFSPCHLNQKKPKCFRIHERPAARASLLMPHILERPASIASLLICELAAARASLLTPNTPLIRFDSAGKTYIPRWGQEVTGRFEASVGPGRTGRSTLAGDLVRDESFCPSAKPTGPVTEGINAATVLRPEGDTLLVLDGEGLNNPSAPPRKEDEHYASCWPVL